MGFAKLLGQSDTIPGEETCDGPPSVPGGEAILLHVDELYNWSEWDLTLTVLLKVSIPGEKPLKGSLRILHDL